MPANVTPVTASPARGVEGQNIVLTFVITNDDPLVTVSNIRWEFTGVHIITDITDSSDPHYELFNDRRSLLITQLTSAHQGIYTLFATNEAGTRSSSILLTVEGNPLNLSLFIAIDYQ